MNITLLEHTHFAVALPRCGITTPPPNISSETRACTGVGSTCPGARTAGLGGDGWWKKERVRRKKAASMVARNTRGVVRGIAGCVVKGLRGPKRSGSTRRDCCTCLEASLTVPGLSSFLATHHSNRHGRVRRNFERSRSLFSPYSGDSWIIQHYRLVTFNTDYVQRASLACLHVCNSATVAGLKSPTSTSRMANQTVR